MSRWRRALQTLAFTLNEREAVSRFGAEKGHVCFPWFWLQSRGQTRGKLGCCNGQEMTLAWVKAVMVGYAVDGSNVF